MQADYPQRQVAKGKVCCIVTRCNFVLLPLLHTSPLAVRGNCHFQDKTNYISSFDFLLELRLNKKSCPVMPLFDSPKYIGFKFQLG